MTICRALVAAALLAAVSAIVPAATPFMPVSEVKPGMVGVGRTVFLGTERETFQVHILGVLRNVLGPRRDLILARLEGGPLAETGVIEGMSGSPVYIDGRLVGAVSYALGAFPKVPIAGITPIAEMTEAVETAGPRAASTRPRLELPVTPERLRAALADLYARVAAFAERPEDIQAIGLPRDRAMAIGLALRPIATPLVIGGFSGEAAALLREAFGGAGFVPAVGAGVPDSPPQSAPLEPGDAIGVSLVRGDYEIGATGTVTYVDGDRVYAFGHPFFNLGPTAFPMTRARVYTLLPSLMTSSKIAALGEVVGTIEHDRATTIAGRLGTPPAVVPVAITFRSDRGVQRTLRFEVVHDEFFTPLLTFLAVSNTLTAYERQVGWATFRVQGTLRVARQAPVAYAEVLSGLDAVGAVATAVAGPITALMSNPLEPVRIEGADLTIEASEVPRTAAIERVWLDAVRPRAGDTVPLKIQVRTYGGAQEVHTVLVTLPPEPGEISILVADAAQLAQWEQRELRRQEAPGSVAELIRRLNETRRRNRIYIRLLRPAPGAIVDGQPLPSLPPSILSVLEGDRAGGRFAPLGQAIAGAWELTLDSTVSGSRTLTATVGPPRP